MIYSLITMATLASSEAVAGRCTYFQDYSNDSIEVSSNKLISIAGQDYNLKLKPDKETLERDLLSCGLSENALDAAGKWPFKWNGNTKKVIPLAKQALQYRNRYVSRDSSAIERVASSCENSYSYEKCNAYLNSFVDQNKFPWRADLEKKIPDVLGEAVRNKYNSYVKKVKECSSKTAKAETSRDTERAISACNQASKSAEEALDFRTKYLAKTNLKDNDYNPSIHPQKESYSMDAISKLEKKQTRLEKKEEREREIQRQKEERERKERERRNKKLLKKHKKSAENIAVNSLVNALRSPSTASVVSYNICYSGIHDGMLTYGVHIVLDAQNGFGAYLRQQDYVRVELDASNPDMGRVSHIGLKGMGWKGWGCRVYAVESRVMSPL